MKQSPLWVLTSPADRCWCVCMCVRECTVTPETPGDGVSLSGADEDPDGTELWSTELNTAVWAGLMWDTPSPDQAS